MDFLKFYFLFSISIYSPQPHPDSPHSHPDSRHSHPDSPHSHPDACILTPILRIPTLVPHISTLISHILIFPTPHSHHSHPDSSHSIIPFIPFPNSPFRLLHIVWWHWCFTCYSSSNMKKEFTWSIAMGNIKKVRLSSIIFEDENINSLIRFYFIEKERQHALNTQGQFQIPNHVCSTWKWLEYIWYPLIKLEEFVCHICGMRKRDVNEDRFVKYYSKYQNAIVLHVSWKDAWNQVLNFQV